MNTEWTDEAQGIWVFLEQFDGHIENVSLEILGRAREMSAVCGWDVTAILAGRSVGHLKDAAVQHGADHVLVVEHDLLSDYRTDPYADVLTGLIVDRKPSVMLMGATHDGRDLAGRLAVRLRTGLTADAVRLSMSEDGNMVAHTPGLGGRVLAACTCPKGRPQMATVRPGIFPLPEPDTARDGSVETIEVALKESGIRTEVLRREVGETTDLTRSKRMIVAGLGIDGDLPSVRQLAEVLGADLGVTRPIADEGLIARDYQIGTTGASVRPELMLVLGASGAMHFTSGIEASGTVIAVNIDEEAPIFEHADYGVVDDLHALIPAVLDRMTARSPGPSTAGDTVIREEVPL